MPVQGVDTVIKNIDRFGGGFINHVNKVMKENVFPVLDEQITALMSSEDHSLKDLANLGHPYARKHGLEGKGIHEVPYLVHRQSGRLLSAKKGGVEEATINAGSLKTSAWVGIDEKVAPYALAVIYGTSKMVPRDFLTGGLMYVKPGIMATLQNQLRDLMFNFKATGG